MLSVTAGEGCWNQRACELLLGREGTWRGLVRGTWLVRTLERGNALGNLTRDELGLVVDLWEVDGLRKRLDLSINGERVNRPGRRQYRGLYGV